MQNFSIFNLMKPLFDNPNGQNEPENETSSAENAQRNDLSSPTLSNDKENNEKGNSPPENPENEKKDESLSAALARDFLLRHEGIVTKCRRGKK